MLVKEDNPSIIKNREYLSCIAAVFIVIGLLLIGIQGYPTPAYSPIKDWIGLGLCVIGLIFAWEWLKWNRQRDKMSASDF